MLTTRIQPAALIHLLRGQWQARAMWVINLFLVLWLAYQLTLLVKLFIPVPQVEKGMQPDTVAITTRAVQTPQASARQVAEMHLFGVPVTEQVSVEPAPIEAPDTPLKIVLHGTFSSDDSRLDHAIIADPSSRADSYAVGDQVQGGVRVHEILADRVILERNRRYETLRLMQDELKGVSITTGMASSSRTDRRPDSPGLPILKESPASLDDLVSPQPVREGGKFIGFRLKPLKAPYLLDKLGLQRDDVVTWINEVDLDNPMKGMRALKSISSGDYVNMTVRRNGQDMSLSFYMP